MGRCWEEDWADSEEVLVFCQALRKGWWFAIGSLPRVLGACVASGTAGGFSPSWDLVVRGWGLLGERWVGSKEVLVVCGLGLIWSLGYQHGLW